LFFGTVFWERRNYNSVLADIQKITDFVIGENQSEFVLTLFNKTTWLLEIHFNECQIEPVESQNFISFRNMKDFRTKIYSLPNNSILCTCSFGQLGNIIEDLLTFLHCLKI
jgi:hypothetical protein